MTTDHLRIEQRGAVTSVWMDIQPGQEINALLRSDAHHDSAHCNRKLEKRHLDEAKAKDALILDGGDLFDAMQGRYDPRRSYEDLRPEYMTDRYYDAICEDAAAFYQPYAKNWLLLGKGNHESAVVKNINSDLTTRLASALNSNGGRVVCGGYGGWVVFYFNCQGTRSALRLRYYHGAGGDAPVTRGVIATNRQAVYLPDADIIWNGHNHNEYTLYIKRERITTKGTLYFDNLLCVRTPGYKDDYGQGTHGWEVERGSVPKPQGACWLKFYSDENKRVIVSATSDVR